MRAVEDCNTTAINIAELLVGWKHEMSAKERMHKIDLYFLVI